MNKLLLQARYLHLRRMTAFHLLPGAAGSPSALDDDQLSLAHMPRTGDRPLSLREMFDDRYDDPEDLGP